jgi:hypothetical protein
MMPDYEERLEKQFHAELMASYEAALRLKPPYKSPVFLRMLNEHGGRETANRLLATREPSDGFTQLFLRGKENLKLSVEYTVLRNPWRDLFDDNQLAEARRRLRDVGCEPPPEDKTPTQSRATTPFSD